MRPWFFKKMLLLCCACKEEKEDIFFSKKSNSKRGFSSKCKECHNTYSREHWYPKNSDKQKKSSSEWKKRNRDKVLATRHRVDGKDVKRALIESAGCCQICNSTKNLCLDHEHESSKVRGVLCVGCNTLIGRLGDSYEKAIEKIDPILEYLRDKK